MNHRLQSNRSFPDLRAAFSTPRGTNSHPKIVLVFACLSTLLWILPASGHGQGVCDRTPQVRDKLVEVTGASVCGQVTSAQLAGVERLDLSESEISALQRHDFSGLDSLKWLRLNDNSLTELPPGVFSGLTSLEILWLQDNSLTSLPENVFSGLGRLRELVLFENSLSVLPEGLFSGLGALETLRLQDNSLSTLPERVFQGLNRLRQLTFIGNSLSDLPGKVFSGLSNLKYLSLDQNTLSSLPMEIFRGLNALRELSLSDNRLAELSEGIFTHLNSLETLLLTRNPLGTLPVGIFDDVLDTMGSNSHASSLRVDNDLKAMIAFASTEQTVYPGSSVTVTVTLSRELPVAVRIPYSLAGAAPDDLADLSPDPESGLLFPAGETSREIRLRLPENGTSPVETIVLTLSELSRIGLRRSDGSPPDAPFLRAETLVDRPEGRAEHALTVVSLNQPAGLCDRTPQVRDKLLEITGISACGQVTLRQLAQISRLDLSGAGVTDLQPDDFSGLVALQSLLLNGNSLRTLPNGLFSRTRSLREIWLQDNALSNLPPGVLDEVIHGLEDLRVDPHIKARLAFDSAAQETVDGPNVQVRVRLSRALPVAVRVPYSVSGTAAETDYGKLSPSPEVGIVFAAGQTGGKITFTTTESSDALGKTVVLTLGDLSEIRLRRSDGGGEDAPILNAGVLVVRPSGGVVHTVTIVDPDQTVDICDRTPQVRDKLLELTGASGCWQLSRAQMASVRALDLSGSGISSLQQHDFSGLNSLENLSLQDNSLAELPENVFAGLTRLRDLTLYRNSLRTLSKGIFRGLNSLQELWLSTNSLTSLPEEAFSGLSNLQRLSLANNTLRSLPEGIFSGLSALRALDLDFNSLAALPEGIFSGLGSLEQLMMWNNQLNSLPTGVFRGLHSLKRLWLSDNSLTILPAGIFDDIIDTLGPAAHDFGDLWLDPHLKATVAFASAAQRAFHGHRVRVRVNLTRALPLAVRVPFSVSGAAPADDYAELLPDPDSGLLFLAGETSKEIVFSLSNIKSTPRTTVNLTLGKLCGFHKILTRLFSTT